MGDTACWLPPANRLVQSRCVLAPDQQRLDEPIQALLRQPCRIESHLWSCEPQCQRKPRAGRAIRARGVQHTLVEEDTLSRLKVELNTPRFVHLPTHEDSRTHAHTHARRTSMPESRKPLQYSTDRGAHCSFALSVCSPHLLSAQACPERSVGIQLAVIVVAPAIVRGRDDSEAALGFGDRSERNPRRDVDAWLQRLQTFAMENRQSVW
jgi:hypothetical protein